MPKPDLQLMVLPKRQADRATPAKQANQPGLSCLVERIDLDDALNAADRRLPILALLGPIREAIERS